MQCSTERTEPVGGGPMDEEALWSVGLKEVPSSGHVVGLDSHVGFDEPARVVEALVK